MTSTIFQQLNKYDPYFVGFDRLFNRLNAFETNPMDGGNYPPYNIRRDGKDKYAIELAVAGFNKDDVEVEFEDNLLTVKTKKVDKTVEKDGNEIIHKGISQRSFSKSFTIADDVRVNGAELKDGLLTISCEKIVPEQKKKKLISIK